MAMHRRPPNPRPSNPFSGSGGGGGGRSLGFSDPRYGAQQVKYASKTLLAKQIGFVVTTLVLLVSLISWTFSSPAPPPSKKLLTELSFKKSGDPTSKFRSRVDALGLKEDTFGTDKKESFGSTSGTDKFGGSKDAYGSDKKDRFGSEKKFTNDVFGSDKKTDKTGGNGVDASESIDVARTYDATTNKEAPDGYRKVSTFEKKPLAQNSTENSEAASGKEPLGYRKFGISDAAGDEKGGYDADGTNDRKFGGEDRERSGGDNAEERFAPPKLPGDEGEDGQPDPDDYRKGGYDSDGSTDRKSEGEDGESGEKYSDGGVTAKKRVDPSKLPGEEDEDGTRTTLGKYSSGDKGGDVAVEQHFIPPKLAGKEDADSANSGNDGRSVETSVPERFPLPKLPGEEDEDSETSAVKKRSAPPKVLGEEDEDGTITAEKTGDEAEDGEITVVKKRSARPKVLGEEDEDGATTLKTDDEDEDSETSAVKKHSAPPKLPGGEDEDGETTAEKTGDEAEDGEITVVKKPSALPKVLGEEDEDGATTAEKTGDEAEDGEITVVKKRSAPPKLPGEEDEDGAITGKTGDEAEDGEITAIKKRSAPPKLPGGEDEDGETTAEKTGDEAEDGEIIVVKKRSAPPKLPDEEDEDGVITVKTGDGDEDSETSAVNKRSAPPKLPGEEVEDGETTGKSGGDGDIDVIDNTVSQRFAPPNLPEENVESGEITGKTDGEVSAPQRLRSEEENGNIISVEKQSALQELPGDETGDGEIKGKYAGVEVSETAFGKERSAPPKLPGDENKDADTTLKNDDGGDEGGETTVFKQGSAPPKLNGVEDGGGETTITTGIEGGVTLPRRYTQQKITGDEDGETVPKIGESGGIDDEDGEATVLNNITLGDEIGATIDKHVGEGKDVVGAADNFTDRRVSVKAAVNSGVGKNGDSTDTKDMTNENKDDDKTEKSGTDDAVSTAEEDSEGQTIPQKTKGDEKTEDGNITSTAENGLLSGVKIPRTLELTGNQSALLNGTQISATTPTQNAPLGDEEESAIKIKSTVDEDENELPALPDNVHEDEEEEERASSILTNTTAAGYELQTANLTTLAKLGEMGNFSSNYSDLTSWNQSIYAAFPVEKKGNHIRVSNETDNDHLTENATKVSDVSKISMGTPMTKRVFSSMLSPSTSLNSTVSTSGQTIEKETERNPVMLGDSDKPSPVVSGMKTELLSSILSDAISNASAVTTLNSAMSEQVVNVTLKAPEEKADAIQNKPNKATASGTSFLRKRSTSNAALAPDEVELATSGRVVENAPATASKKDSLTAEGSEGKMALGEISAIPRNLGKQMLLSKKIDAEHGVEHASGHGHAGSQHGNHVHGSTHGAAHVHDIQHDSARRTAHGDSRMRSAEHVSAQHGSGHEHGKPQLTHTAKKTFSTINNEMKKPDSSLTSNGKGLTSTKIEHHSMKQPHSSESLLRKLPKE
jgi:hypothetical protein